MPWCGSLRCAADACAAAVQGSQCCAHTVTVPCSTMAAGVLAMVPARTLKRMLGRSVVGGGCLMLSTVQCWGLMRRIGCTLTVRTGCLECLNGLACLTACLSRCLSVYLSGLLLVSCGQRAAGTSSPLSPCRVGMKSSVTFRVGRLNPAKQPLVNRSVSPWGRGGWNASTQHAAHTPASRPESQELARRQVPGTRSLTLWGWMGGK